MLNAKKLMSLFILFSLFASCVQHEEANLEDAKQIVIERELGAEYKTRMNKVLNNYFNIKDALVVGDSLTARDESILMVLEVEEIAYTLVPEEDKFRWLKKSDAILLDAKSITQAKTLADQRKAFDPLSKTIYDVVTEIGVDSMVVYKQYCPMAFDNVGAAWLSREAEVLNPYFGDVMLRCGVIEEVVTVK